MSQQLPIPCQVADADIVRQLRTTGSEGLEQLLQKYGGQVRHNIRRDFGTRLDHADVDEVLNEAAYSAWSRAETFDESRGRLGTWFYVIARHAAVHAIRRQKRNGNVFADVDFGTLPANEATALGHGEASLLSASGVFELEAPSEEEEEFRRVVRECVARLKGMQRAIIEADMRAGDCADAADLARQFKTSKNSIYVSRSAARKNVRQYLRERGHFLEPVHAEGETEQG